MNMAEVEDSIRHVELVAPDDFEEWRDAARALVAEDFAPQRVSWSVAGEGSRDLFGAAAPACTARAVAIGSVRASPAFVELARMALLHRAPERHGLLYAVLWRLQRNRDLLADAADPQVRALEALARTVRRDIHKMRAFLRFRSVIDADGGERFVAWFEPEHHVVRANARFFIERFANQRWSILTPDLSLHWDGEALHEAPGARREDAPLDDAAEKAWQRYYASIFNPARLKVGAMLKEMPRKYWKNMPEARLIPELIASAQAREAAMIVLGRASEELVPASSLSEIVQGIAVCRRCAIGCNGTRAVSGEGPERAQVMILGEQPGDTEEMQGRPFVGPAGELLDRHLKAAGIDREGAYVTNAVKHFKFAPRGKRRLHQNPTAGEIDHCRWWLDAERAIVQPQLILALGASAGRAVLGRTPSIGRERGQIVTLPDGARLLLTSHPSYLLRLQGEAQVREEEHFARDLGRFAEAMRS